MTRRTTKPLPPHGERARYLRGCRCHPCREANKRYCKQYRIKALHKPIRIDATPVRQRLQQWTSQGYSLTQIGTAVGKNSGEIWRILNGQQTIAPRVAAQILNAPAPTGIPTLAKVDSTGTIRRGRALHAIGYPIYAIAARIPMGTDHLAHILDREPATVSLAVANGMRTLYQQLSGRPGGSPFAVHNARRRGWAPPAAWDDDAIDAPEAHPDWTGCCGTDRGWWLHRIEHIPTCPRCEQAHEQWKTERAHLSRSEFFSELGKAQAAARSREANLAHDARELMRFGGLDQQLAAERLGVTRSHLQQALFRHPAQPEEVAA